MNVAIIGKGLIGGSLEKAALRAKHNAEIFRGRGQLPDLSRFDFVFLAVPPSAVEGKVREIAASAPLREGAVVMDISGVKGSVCRALADFENTKGWTFIGAHPMAGKEKLGYENSCENLFDGASMILTPFESTGKAVVESTSEFLKTLGFARVVVTDTDDHDGMIAYTSQLCHLISSAYVRENLSARHAGYSAGSFRDMVRVGAPDPDTWTELFFENKSHLLPVLDRYINRLARFRDALAADDRATLHADLEEGVEAKKKIDEEKESI